MKTNKENILKWFTGKKREKAEAALDMVLESEVDGAWIPKASRFSRAAFSKANVAEKLYRKSGFEINSLRETKYGDNDPSNGWNVNHCLQFGGFDRIQKIDFDKLNAAATTDEEKSVLAQAEEYKNDFAELSQLMKDLDATRPKPVFTYLGVSPTVTHTLKDMRLDLDTDTVRMCPWEWFKVEVEPGRFEMHTRLLWPKNTVHGASRFSSNFTHCHACGHAIRNNFNWVPILIDDKDGVPHSMWLGQDCAKSVFGVKVSGKIVPEGGKQ